MSQSPAQGWRRKTKRLPAEQPPTGRPGFNMAADDAPPTPRKMPPKPARRPPIAKPATGDPFDQHVHPG